LERRRCSDTPSLVAVLGSLAALMKPRPKLPWELAKRS
jgi:hypothetical protein